VVLLVNPDLKVNPEVAEHQDPVVIQAPMEPLVRTVPRVRWA